MIQQIEQMQQQNQTEKGEKLGELDKVKDHPFGIHADFNYV